MNFLAFQQAFVRDLETFRVKPWDRTQTLGFFSNPYTFSIYQGEFCNSSKHLHFETATHGTLFHTAPASPDALQKVGRSRIPGDLAYPMKSYPIGKIPPIHIYVLWQVYIYINIWFIVIVAYHFARSNPVVIPDLASFTKKKGVFASLSCLTRPSVWIKVIRTKVSAKEAFVQPATQPIFKSRRLNDSIIHLHVSGHFGKIVPYKFPDFFGRSRLGWSSLPLFAPQC